MDHQVSFIRDEKHTLFRDFPMGHHQLINSSFHTIFTNHYIYNNI